MAKDLDANGFKWVGNPIGDRASQEGHLCLLAKDAFGWCCFLISDGYCTLKWHWHHMRWNLREVRPLSWHDEFGKHRGGILKGFLTFIYMDRSTWLRGKDDSRQYVKWYYYIYPPILWMIPWLGLSEAISQMELTRCFTCFQVRSAVWTLVGFTSGHESIR